MFGALMVAENIAFYLIAAVMVGAALRVVTTKDIVHAALYLVLVLSGVAALYILVLVYIGAIVVLFLFGIMLTRAPGGKLDDSGTEQRIIGGTIAVLLAGVMSFVLYKAFTDVQFDFSGPNVVQTTDQVANSVFSTYLVPFEAISVLLLAALIGAVVLARRD